jgi:hypothetical protein
MADDELGKVARAIRKKHSPMVFDTPPPLSAYFPLSRAGQRPLTKTNLRKHLLPQRGRRPNRLTLSSLHAILSA